MFQRDSVLRLVEQLGRALGSVLALKKARRFDEAELAIAEAAKKLIGMDVESLLALSVDQLPTIFSPGGILDAGKCLVVAELLSEQGAVSELRGDEAGAYRARSRALGLLLEVSAREGLDRVPDSDGYRQKLDELTGALSGYPASVEIQRRRIEHLEREGRFALAEDLLFELVDEGHPGLASLGVAMYERLLARSDDELERGGLPRVEVLDGLAELKSRRESTA